jgi:hypothetical protein
MPSHTARCPPSLIAEGGQGLGRSPGEGSNSSRDCNGPGSCSWICAMFSIGSLLFLLLGLAVLYGVIRLAVRDGIRDATVIGHADSGRHAGDSFAESCAPAYEWLRLAVSEYRPLCGAAPGAHGAPRLCGALILNRPIRQCHAL